MLKEKEMRSSSRMHIKNEEYLAREVMRALRFLASQVEKDYTIIEALHQVKGSYGERVHYYVSLEVYKMLEEDK